MRTSVRRSEKGFTLIELGIVVAVIAILATVVLFGRGFLTSAGQAKALEAVNTIRKAASTYTGVTGGNVALDAAGCLAGLTNRQLLPPAAAAGNWTVGGVIINSCEIENLAAGSFLNVQLTAPEDVVAEDLWATMQEQGNEADCTGIAAAPGVGGAPVLLACFAL